MVARLIFDNQFPFLFVIYASFARKRVGTELTQLKIQSIHSINGPNHDSFIFCVPLLVPVLAWGLRPALISCRTERRNPRLRTIERPGNRDADYEDANDACRFPVVDARRGKLDSQQRQRHGFSGSEQNYWRRRASRTGEVQDCQKSKCGHEQWKPNSEICLKPPRACHPRGFFHVRSNLDKYRFHDVDTRCLSLNEHYQEQCPVVP